jgi:RNA polymerase sigma-70 factor (ECF subfamily)
MSAESNKKPSDEDLLRVIRAEPGSRRAKTATSELFHRYRGRVYQWCYRYTGSHDTAMDMSQEVFLGAYQSLETFGGRARFSSWLFAIARNRCISALRKVSPLNGAAGDEHMPADPRSGPDSGIELEQEREKLLALMRETLEPVEQEALCLRIYERLPVDSITQILGITGSTGARGVLQNARRKLRAAAERFKSEGESSHE